MLKSSSKHSLCLAIALLVSSICWSIVPSGYYYFARNKKKAALKTALHDYAAPMKELDYGGGAGFTWEGFFSTDNHNDTVIDMYSNTKRLFNGFSAVDGMHIEHSFPKSWWGAYPNEAYKDLFHLYPADAVTNITKSNLPLGEVTGTPSLNNGVTKIGINGFGTEYSENCFEPADEYKGDFARSYFYISTIYENYAALWSSPMLNNNTYPVWKPWALDLLLKWHRQDPVSAKELARVEAIYNIQGNRNPFIDYPDLVEHIWGTDTATVYPFPEETEPFLLTPRRGAKLDFGVILSSDSRSKNINIQGVNINADVQVALLHNNPAFTLSSTTIPAATTLNGINLAISFSPQSAGLFADTLLIQGGGLSEILQVPIKALASSNLITLEPTDVSPVGGTLQWISDPQATDYRLSVYQGDQQAGDLIISTYMEGSSWNKAIELYNGTGRTIDLSNYSLKKQSDGSGAFSSTLDLSGTLANNSSYVIVNRKCTTTALRNMAQLLDTLVLNVNGNDAIALVRNGVTIDMVGQANAGADVNWGADVTLQRNSNVTHPISTYNSSEWTKLPIDSYSMLGNHTMTLATSSNYVLQNISTGNATSYQIENLTPKENYTYKVEAVKPEGNINAINTSQLNTLALDIPILMEPTNINSNSFTANWEETLHATGYLLNVFKTTGRADTTEVEGFASVGSSGTPLPTGWSGTASGNYTTTTSYGIATPSIGLKNNGEWLQTKTYPEPASKLTLMYRFASAATNSSLAIYGLSNVVWTRIDSIVYVNTSKAYPSYTFTRGQGMSAFKFIYHKAAGNLSIDDVQVTYGNSDTTYVLRNTPVATATQYLVPYLTENSHYFYNVRATLGSSISVTSETVGLRTLMNTGSIENKAQKTTVYGSKEIIHISGLEGNETIHVYSLTGVCLKQVKSSSSTLDIPFSQQGIFIVYVQGGKYNTVFKVIK